METETESVAVIVKALVTNLAIAAVNGTVGLLSRNQGLTTEAVHSVIDSVTEVLLLFGTWHGRRWDNARYFWGLLASVSMFAVGGVWAIWEGIAAIEQPAPWVSWSVWVSTVVLMATSYAESTSWSRAVRAMATERAGRSWFTTLRSTKNTEVKAIIVEDSADLLGRFLALAGTVLAFFTGTTIWYGWASVLIGLMLVVMALELGVQNVRLLVTKEAMAV